jgi:hypothetical protein
MPARYRRIFNDNRSSRLYYCHTTNSTMRRRSPQAAVDLNASGSSLTHPGGDTEMPAQHPTVNKTISKSTEQKSLLLEIDSGSQDEDDDGYPRATSAAQRRLRASPKLHSHQHRIRSNDGRCKTTVLLLGAGMMLIWMWWYFGTCRMTIRNGTRRRHFEF